jgi:hypothetical protein
VRKIAAVGGLCALTLISLVAICGPGEVTEFSPETLCYRDKDVWSIPIADIPVFWRVKVMRPHPLQQMWLRHGYITGSEPSGAWDLVRSWSPGSPAKETGIHDLTCPKEVNSSEYWESWTRSNPQKAGELWPKIINSIRSRRYAEAVADMQKHAW